MNKIVTIKELKESKEIKELEILKEIKNCKKELIKTINKRLIMANENFIDFSESLLFYMLQSKDMLDKITEEQFMDIILDVLYLIAEEGYVIYINGEETLVDFEEIYKKQSVFNKFPLNTPYQELLTDIDWVNFTIEYKYK